MNFVCLVFELGDKTLPLSPMENLMVKCNLKKNVVRIYSFTGWRASQMQLKVP